MKLPKLHILSLKFCMSRGLKVLSVCTVMNFLSEVGCFFTFLPALVENQLFSVWVKLELFERGLLM